MGKADSSSPKLPAHLISTRPTTYTLELTSNCNHQCVGCGNVFRHQGDHLSAASWEKILDRIGDGLRSLRITGGECTLHPEFGEILHIIDQLSIPFVIFTNGNWVNASSVIRNFTNCQNLKGILISLHGYDKTSFQRFVNCDTFNVVTRNIQRAADAGIHVGTNTILLRHNVTFIERITEQSLSLGAASVAFSRYYGRSLPELELCPTELYSALIHLAKLKSKEPRVVLNNCVPLCFAPNLNLRMKGCTSGFSHCTIDPWGNARPCTHSPFMLGNVFKQSIADIWNGDPLRRWRELVPEECISCAAFELCKGGCRATSYHRELTRDPLMRSPIQVLDPIYVPLNLSRHACPIPNYTMYEQECDIRLVNNNHQIIVAKTALPILHMIDGQTPLAEILSEFGDAAVDFVGTLILQGFLKYL